ncbi:hypothetical protein HDU82_003194 [Entophlyctis luteolus]|nr:hypothetical protein HDU82_003194 [Entophlyctis luteolus]
MASNGSLRNLSKDGLKFGLIRPRSSSATNTTAKNASNAHPRPANRSSTFFAEDDDDYEDDGAAARPHGSGRHIQSSRGGGSAVFVAAPNARIEKTKLDALKEDPNIFDYDAAYDAMKEQEDAQRRKRDVGEQDAGGRKKPRYVANLLAASLQRKIELERVEDRKVARERALEGDMFGDKDAFVTDAYKTRQEELKRLEEEEKQKEALQRTGGDMTEFYRGLLNSHEQITTRTTLSAEELAVVAAERGRRAKELALEEKEQLEEAIRRGEVALNASNEIVDKRTLLKGGLNISRAKVRAINEEREAEERDQKRIQEEEQRKRREERDRKLAEAEKRRAKDEQARRLLEESERQRVEAEQKRIAEAARQKEELIQSLAKKATEDVVLDARARYLARKKAQEEKKDEEDSE